MIICFIHGAGGQLLSPDLEVAIDSDAAVDALEFYRSMRELCPPGATGYSWGETLSAFVSGATATGLYAGRVLVNVNSRNPRLKDHITCVPLPTVSAEVPTWTFNDYPSVFIPADAPDLEMTRRFAAWLYEGEGYIRQLHATPGHILPVLKTAAEDERYLDHELVRRYRNEIALMSTVAAAGHNLGWESPEHRINVKAGALVNSGILAEMVQRVVLNGEKPRRVLADTARRIEAIMKA